MDSRKINSRQMDSRKINSRQMVISKLTMIFTSCLFAYPFMTIGRDDKVWLKIASVLAMPDSVHMASCACSYVTHSSLSVIINIVFTHIGTHPVLPE